MLVHSKIDFGKKVSDWDGFGFNYVETAQTIDYTTDPQDYGGFSILSPEKRDEIIELVFGENGLRPAKIKMFLDPFHQTEEHVNAEGIENIDQNNYDHKTSTKWIRYFAKAGNEMSEKYGRKLEIITTLYGPPPFMTVQKFMRGRDLDHKYREELAKYMTAWAMFLRDEEGLPIKYISLHNEGEDYSRWPEDGSDGNIGTGHDYNLYWSAEDVVSFIPLLRRVLDANGCPEIGVTPGENTNWTRFFQWGYADEIADNEQAVNAMGLITSHGFCGHSLGEVWWGDHRSVGSDRIRAVRPELHSWVTSTSWSKMNSLFVYQIYGNIYCAKNNAIIPWAGIQRPTKWVGGDPNPGNAIQITEDGDYVVRDGYYYYKQVCSVGQSGMYAARTACTDTRCCAIAFASNGTDNPNSFVLVNTADEEARFDLTVLNADKCYKVTRTSPTEHGVELDDVILDGSKLEYIAPADSVTTFTAI